MSELDGAGMADAGGSVDNYQSGDSGSRIVAEVGPPASYEASRTVQKFKDAAFDAMADSDDMDATDYIEERKDRDAEAAGDPEVNKPHRKQARAARFHRALEAAERVGENGGASEDRLTQAHQEAVSESQEADLRAKEHETIRATAQYEMRVAEFAKQNPDYHEWVQSILPVFPPHEEVAGALLRSPYGPQLTYELVNNIEALEKLNSLPPSQALNILAKAEGILMAQEAGQRQAASIPPPRRATKAGAPLTPLRGGGSAPSADPENMSMDDYVAKRRSGWNG
jgi:hypothetical protein